MNQSRLIIISLCILIFSFKVQSESFGNIMLLGDSVTQGAGGSDKQGFRYELWKKLVANGDTFDFVGSHDIYFFQKTYTPPSYLNQSFDKSHEGHWGWTTSDILGITKAWGGNINEWLDNKSSTTYTPDTAIILLGFNDILKHNNSGQANGTAIDIAHRLETIINTIKADYEGDTNKKGLKIFVGTLYEYNFSSTDSSITDVNSRTASQQKAVWANFNSILKGNFANDNGVTIVDLTIPSGFDTTNSASTDSSSFLYDGLHPNQRGERFIAEKFHNAMTPAKNQTSAIIDSSALQK